MSKTSSNIHVLCECNTCLRRSQSQQHQTHRSLHLGRQRQWQLLQRLHLHQQLRTLLLMHSRAMRRFLVARWMIWAVAGLQQAWVAR